MLSTALRNTPKSEQVKFAVRNGSKRSLTFERDNFRACAVNFFTTVSAVPSLSPQIYNRTVTLNAPHSTIRFSCIA